jgi:hypothetical protein
VSTSDCGRLGFSSKAEQGRNLSLTTAVDFRFSCIGSVTLDGQSGFRGWKHNVIDFTVGIKFN